MEKPEERIKELIVSDLVIKRVPQNQLRWFKEYAREEFENDYGMLLRELVQFYRGMYSETILTGIDLVHEKLDKLLRGSEQPKKESAPKMVKMANGREIKLEE